MTNDWVEGSLAESKVARTLDIYISGSLPCGHTVLSRAIADGEIFARYRGETEPRPALHWASLAEEQMQFSGDHEWYSIPTRHLEVRRDMLHLWVKEHESSLPRPHRPAGTGLHQADEPFVLRIISLMANNEGMSSSGAALRVVGDGSGVPGAGTPESKVSRLVRRIKKRLAENNGA
jgi:hypothetical protein